ncbi:UDP-forming cellulose synthase catalytic subunit [Gluconacetobacter tumulisoli]|uniref:Cellulose synthase n=2 Tax=Gluconacetobacter tumulisoli TaxID=1286189 RepID=A0A7W4K7B7_9PROT|nr:UDP-forming cellulose synthase catalytic subunit [Gluconacetobacter tumulisoli]
MENGLATTERFLSSPFVSMAVAALGIGMMLVVGGVELSLYQQGLLSIGTIGLMLLVKRRKGRAANCYLMALSLLVSMRYMAWRLNTTIEWGNWLQAILSMMLLLAEIYALLILCLSYFQMVWPLRRRSYPLPADQDGWPTIDVYIPTYGEDLAVVRPTVLASLDLDWPADKLNVYVLDDGRRREFRDFAIEVGAGYITRADNRHAKAGNLNHAVSVTDGELMVVFDCDHVPTRGFLKKTVGWLVAEPGMAMLQTPHHFYSSDPFQRNLTAAEEVPPEGNMFYGLIQDGNDFWDATFFCGSCAVIRRTAVLGIGGFATETVTEDAHTALKMQRQGWSTAYLREPLAGGLATERLIFHIGQRMRWARGMLQIMRLDNPLTGRGLRWEQRLCYLSAMSHFLFAIPRVIFLISPLAFLALGQNIVAASPLAIMVYVGPHIVHSIMTLSRIEGRWRYTFWSEIYETSLALFLVRLTVMTLLRPQSGRFNVTAKGTLLEKDFLDFGAIYPNVILAAVLGAGLVRGVIGAIWQHQDRLVFQSLMLNMVWAAISLFTVLASISVGRETRQTRMQHRVRAVLPITVTTASGNVWTTRTTDISLGGLGMKSPWTPSQTEQMQTGQMQVTIGYRNAQDAIDVSVPARILRQRDGLLHAKWVLGGLADERQVVAMVFGRHDAWAEWANYAPDRPIRSFYIVLKSIIGLFKPRAGYEGRTLPVTDKAAGAAAKEEKLEKRSLVLQPARRTARCGAVASFMIAFGIAATGAMAVARAQTTTPLSSPSVQSDLPLGDPNAGDVAPAAQPAIDQAAADRVSDVEVTNTLSFRDLGAVNGPLTLRGSSPIQGLDVAVPFNRVVTHAQLTLSGALSPSLLPEASAVTVTLNEQYIGTIKVDPEHPEFGPLTFDVNPLYFAGRNTLNFHFAGEYRRDCNDLYNEVLWARISDLSRITLTTVRIAPERMLARLPAPFFDPNLRSALRIPIVLPSPTSGSLQAGGVIASWFGKVADFRAVSFPVTADIPVAGNAIEIGENLPTDPDGRLPMGPTLAEIPNPHDRWGTVLLVTGRDAREVEIAARTMVLSPDTLGAVGSKVVTDVTMTPRRPYDAPAFVPTDRPVRFGELVPARDLQADGFVPAPLALPFHLPPDLYTWRHRPFMMNLWVRAPGGPIVDLETSRLDVRLNDNYLQSYSLVPPGTWDRWSRRLMDPHAGAIGHRTALPAWLVFGQNRLQFDFDARPIDHGACRRVPGDLRMSVDSDSTLDFRRGRHFATLPNLSYFTGAAFPFSRMADLSETTIVMPRNPDVATAAAYFDLMGFFGASTWYPATGVRIAYPDELAGHPPSGDIVLLSTADRLYGAEPLLSRSPYVVAEGRISVGQHIALPGMGYLFGDRDHGGIRNGISANLNVPIAGAGLLIGAQSPFAADRSVVAVLGDTPQRLQDVVLALRDRHAAPLIQGDLALKNGDQVTSYRTAPSYTVGSLPFWMWPDWYFGDNPVVLYLVGLVGAGLLALVAWRWLRVRAVRRGGSADPAEEP